MSTIERYLTYRNLVEVIQGNREETARGITFVEGDEEEQFISYSRLYKKALNFLFHLQSKGLKPGDELVFQIDDNLNFILTFWACLLGHIIPVPVTTAVNDRFRAKLFSIWESLNNPYLITVKKHLEKLELFAAKDNPDKMFNPIKTKAILLDDIKESADGNKGEIYYPEETDIAFIQFSSGSTSQSKGVILTHKNLMTNINAMIKGTMLCGERDRSLSWMPLTHDMGLIGFHLTISTARVHHLIMPTILFIRYPSLWLKKISQEKITITSSPNFGYKHLLRFFDIKKMPGLDLSSLRLIFNGAEPISLELSNQFLDEMAPLGLKKHTMFPVYGLAEASLAVSFPVPGQTMKPVYVDRNSVHFNQKIKELEKDKGLSFVEVGTPVDDCYLKIADDNGREVGDRVVGHILIKGDNVTSGYYNNREATKQVINADGWLDTGDLGFLRDGCLVITGRVKDTIFANGHTYFAHDIEYAAEDLPGFKINRTAVVGVFNRQMQMDEIICFVLFRKKDMNEFLTLTLELKKWVVKKVGVGMSLVIPVKQIPITTSGKIQRYKLKEAYLKGEFDPVLKEMAELQNRN
jgi:acyl-CoA synthetase (AMP-forming)/AMP-acid ligase II